MLLLLLAMIALVSASGPVLGQEAAAPPPAEAPNAVAGAADAAGRPEGVFYISPVWLGLITAVVAMWLYVTSWVSADAKGVGVDYQLYASLMLAAGGLGLLFVFLASGAFVFLMALLVLGMFSVYIVIRNGVVPERFRFLGAHHRTALLSKIPVLNALATLQPPLEAGWHECVLTNNAGTSLDDILVEQPSLQQAAAVLGDLVFRAGITRSRRLRLQPTGGHYTAQCLLDGVLYSAQRVEAELAGQMLACVAKLAGLSKGGKIRQGTRPLGTELPGTGPLSIEATIGASGGRPSLQLEFPNWTHDLYKGGLEALGVHEAIIRRIQAAIEQKTGLILVCGPPASGKTSTLCAMVSAVDIFTSTVAMIEVQPEPDVADVRRFSVREGGSFASTFEEMMREGADAILMSEMQNPEQARMLLPFAERGLVLTGLTAPDAPEALLHAVKLADDADSVCKSTTCVVPQRLVRELCVSCREPADPNPALLERLRIPIEEAGTWFRPVGCEACLSSGYHGRTGIFGMLILTDPVKEELHEEGATAQSIGEVAGKAAFRTMYQDGISKVTAGITTIDEVRRVLRDQTANEDQGP